MKEKLLEFNSEVSYKPLFLFKSVIWFVILPLVWGKVLAQQDHRPPEILFTDVISGPNNGGENNNGAYLSLFGLNFGSLNELGISTKVYINEIEIADYKFIGDAVSQPFLPYKKLKQITVQIGQLANAPYGVELPIRLEVKNKSSNTDHTFIIQPGNILYVDPVNGNDQTAVANDITKPWRYVQTASSLYSGAFGAASPGDFIVLRGGVWNDVGYANRFFRISNMLTGTQPNGEPENGYYTFIGYPGEEVRIVPQPNTYGGFHGPSSAFRDYGNFVVIANMKIEGGNETVKDGPINPQNNATNWRLVNNELFHWEAASEDVFDENGNQLIWEARSGGISFAGAPNIKIFGNWIHHIGGGTKNHGIYYGGGDNGEIAYNHVHDISGGNIMQLHDNIGGYSLKNIFIHHNLMYEGSRYGMNVGAGTDDLKFYNNIVFDTDYAGIRFTWSDFDVIDVNHNTFYNVNRKPPKKSYGAIDNDDKVINESQVIIKNNIIYASVNSNVYYSASAQDPNISMERNLWYGIGETTPEKDSNPIYGNPLFNSIENKDFSLQGNSIAIDSGILIDDIHTDFYLNARPYNNISDVGACEYHNYALTIPEEEVEEIFVFPNPSQGVIRLMVPEGDIQTIIIYDGIGKKVLSTEQEHIDLSLLSSGVYYLRVFILNSEKSIVKKIVKY